MSRKAERRKALRLTVSPINQTVPITAIKPHPDNYNYHPPSQLAQLGRSYEELGQFRSLVLWAQDDGTFLQLAGHGVVEAMTTKGATEVRADVYPSTLDPMIAKQILIADNLHAFNSEPDNELLSALLTEQKNSGLDLSVLGTNNEALEQMLKELAQGVETHDDPLPEPGDAPVSEISDQWALLISCEDEDQQLELLERFQSEGLTCRVLIS